MAKLIQWGSVIYPNDDYDGGEIHYPTYNFSYKPEAGSAIFHSGYTMHGVKKVTLGERYCITGLIEEAGAWNPTPLPTPTNNPESDPFLYPSGYWGKRMPTDPNQEEVKILRQDGTVANYVEYPVKSINEWLIEHDPGAPKL